MYYHSLGNKINKNKNNNRRSKGTVTFGGKITLLTALVAVAGDNFVPCIQVQGFQYKSGTSKFYCPLSILNFI